MSKLVYARPARNWYEALPAGNGKTAIMVAGGSRRETIWFNDAELWSGYPKNHDNSGARDALKEARKLVAEGLAADDFVKRHLCGNYSEAYMPLARLKLQFDARDGAGYERILDLEEGVMTIADSELAREAFVSFPHGVAVYGVTGKGKFSVTIGAASPLRHTVEANSGILTVSGNAPDYAAPNYLRTKLFPVRYNEKKAAAFCLAVRAETDGAAECRGKRLKIVDATYVRLYAVTETGFKGYDEMPEHDRRTIKAKAIAALNATERSYEAIKKAHIADYRALMSRQKLVLKEGKGDVAALLAQAKRGDTDAELINLLYDYGKYMTICGSRSSQPLNLQGQWNKSVRPPWSSNLTTNINAQMNYWGASRVGLEECLKPFYRAITEIAARGKKTAKTNCGMRGFVCHHNVDIWRNTSPVQGDPGYMYSPMCGAWLANEMYAHKQNCGSVDREAVEVISEAARFCLDYLWEYRGKLVTAPSTSPETAYLRAGKRCAVGMASAYETAVVRQTFENCLRCDADPALKAEISAVLPRLAPFERAENGLAEWAGGKMSCEKGHRHFSPLYGVYPGNVIRAGTPEFELAEQLFLYRLRHASSSIGWSAAWAICLAGRFGDRETAKKVVGSFAARSVMSNLFDFHPPFYFQIDGNIGFVAGINELLMTEDGDAVRLLPACFDTIAEGEMCGAVIKGIKLDFAWKDGKVIRVSADRPIKIKKSGLAAGAVLENVQAV